MANFTTADDKRIWQLQPEAAPSLDMSLPIDRNGNIGAKRITLLELLNLLSSDGPKQDANAGTTNPDNTFGVVGDFYFKIPEDGSSLTMFKKVTSNSWSTVFNLPIGGGTTSDVVYRSFTIPEADITEGVVSLVGRTNDQGDQIIPAKATWTVETEDGSVGRYSNATQTVDGLGSGGIEVYLVGVEPVEPTGLSLENTTDRDMKYALNGFLLLDFPIGETIIVNPGDSLIMQLDSASDLFFVLVNQNGDLQNTDGLYRIDENPRQWDIPSDTTYLEILVNL